MANQVTRAATNHFGEPASSSPTARDPGTDWAVLGDPSLLLHSLSDTIKSVNLTGYSVNRWAFRWSLMISKNIIKSFITVYTLQGETAGLGPGLG